MKYLKYQLFAYDDDGKPMYYAELAGKSGDTKPTSGLVSGSKFLETDTGVEYVLDAESNPAAWTEIVVTTAATE